MTPERLKEIREHVARGREQIEAWVQHGRPIKSGLLGASLELSMLRDLLDHVDALEEEIDTYVRTGEWASRCAATPPVFPAPANARHASLPAVVWPEDDRGGKP